MLAQELIADMINHDSLKRPPTRAILQHPFFWNQKKILAFLQDVSDRVEKLTFSTDPLKTLEKNGRMIVRRSWHLHLDTEITADLRKYRGYMEESVRDLLRAVRNKVGSRIFRFKCFVLLRLTLFFFITSYLTEASLSRADGRRSKNSGGNSSWIHQLLDSTISPFTIPHLSFPEHLLTRESFQVVLRPTLQVHTAWIFL